MLQKLSLTMQSSELLLTLIHGGKDKNGPNEFVAGQSFNNCGEISHRRGCFGGNQLTVFTSEVLILIYLFFQKEQNIPVINYYN